jgi:hypothetical protein
MAGDQVFMEVPAVRNMGKSFQQISQVLKQAANTAQVLANILKSNAFTNMVGAAVIVLLEQVLKPDWKYKSEKCAEISKDLAASADAYERGDQQGATRFY